MLKKSLIVMGLVALMLVLVVPMVAEAAGPGGHGRMGHGVGFVDEDGDGICDNCPGFVDEDGDGICDNCPGFVDEDGDGICDNMTTYRGGMNARHGRGFRWQQ